MTKTRMEAFSDGVVAILITIMVLELKVPHAPEIEALKPVAPLFLSYALSFVYLGIYWNNHHHMLQASKHVNGRILWANLHLLFWLSLIPFTTTWVGENPTRQIPTVVYGLNLLLAAFAYTVLQHMLVRLHGPGSILDRAFGPDGKGKLSLALYVLGTAGAFYAAWIGQAAFVAVALLWLVPDKRIERVLFADHAHHPDREEPGATGH